MLTCGDNRVGWVYCVCIQGSIYIFVVVVMFIGYGKLKAAF